MSNSRLVFSAAVAALGSLGLVALMGGSALAGTAPLAAFLFAASVLLITGAVLARIDRATERVRIRARR